MVIVLIGGVRRATDPERKDMTSSSEYRDDASPTAEPGADGVNAFVGRQACIASLRTDLDAASRGSGRVVFLSGEPGIGRTRTAQEIARIARGAGLRVFTGRCRERNETAAFAPWITVMRAFMDSDETRGVVRSAPAAAREIAPLVPEICTLWTDAAPVEWLDAPRSRTLLFDAIATLFRRVAAERPVLIVLDDLQWADTSSLLLLDSLARELREARVLIVATFRSGAQEHAPSLAHVIETVTHEQLGRWVELEGLLPADVARWVEGFTGEAAPGDIVAGLHERSGGNPFLLGQLLEMLVADGGWDAPSRRRLSALPPPQGAREVIALHLGLVSEPCRRVMSVASIFGRDFDVESLAAVAALPLDAVAAAMSEAERATLIAKVPDEAGLYRFVHVPTRNALYDRVPIQERARLHVAAAEAIEKRYVGDSEPPLAEVARHRVRATQSGASGRAVSACTAAAQQATRRAAFKEAILWYERALRLLDLEPVSATGRLELLLALADAQRRAGELVNAKATLSRTATAARGAGAPALLVEATLGYASLAIHSVEAQAELVTLLERTLAELAPERDARWVRIGARLSEALLFSESATDQERCLMLSAEVLEVARREGDPKALAAALLARHAATASGPERAELSKELVELFGDPPDPDIAPFAVRARIVDLLEDGDVAGADDKLAELASMAALMRQPVFDFHVALCSTARALLAGRLVEAEAGIQRSRALAQRVAVGAERLATGQWMFLLLHQGRVTEYEAPLRRFHADAPGIHAWRAAMAHLHVERGETYDAVRILDEMTADGLRPLRRDRNRLAIIAMLAEVCPRVDAYAATEALYDALLPHANALVTAGIGLVVLGAASRYLGILATVLERWDAATKHFEDAHAVHLRVGARSFAALGQHDYAHMLLARGLPDDRSRAMTMAEEALATARELGMVGLAQRVEGISRRSRVVRRAPRRS